MNTEEQQKAFEAALAKMAELNARKRAEHGDAYREYGMAGFATVIAHKAKDVGDNWADMNKEELEKKLLYLGNYVVLALLELKNGGEKK